MKMNTGSLIFIVLLPVALVWFVWKKTNWTKQEKWLASAGIVVVFFMLFIVLNNNSSLTHEETVIPSSQIEVLQKQLEAEKQKNAELQKADAPTSETKADTALEEMAIVERVVDGDTIKLSNGQALRYIGIDAPETVAPEKPVQCFGKEAREKDRELVEGKNVMLIKDVSETDKYGRILRYVYVGDVFVNDYLVRNGFAKADNFPPDEKFKDQLKEAQAEAKKNKRGLWADDACKTESTAALVPTISTSATQTPIVTSNSASGGAYACNCAKTCPQMSSCDEAQYQLNSCGCSKRDADKDGIACDADCQ